MENATEALELAGNVLIFILAVSLAIVSFNQVRATADTILAYKDRETVYIDGDFYYEPTGNVRNVGLDTIIPALYRSYDEKYRVVFKFNGNEMDLLINKNNASDKKKYIGFDSGNQRSKKE